MGTKEVLDRRRAERDALLDRARRFSEGVDARLDVRAVVVVGSVARGDFNRWSDVDTVVVAEGFDGSLLERLAQLGSRPAGVELFAWRPEEARARVARSDPMALEARQSGIWLVGSPEVLRTHAAD